MKSQGIWIWILSGNPDLGSDCSFKKGLEKGGESGKS